MVIPCSGCGAAEVRHLWVDRDAALTDPWTAPVAAVCGPCVTEHGYGTTFRLSRDMQVATTLAQLLVVRYASALRRVARHRDASIRCSYWSPSSPDTVRARFLTGAAQ
jgi:hypothetical protein